MNGKYAGYVAGEDPLHGFLSKIMRDRLGVREPQLAFRVFRLSGSNEVYAYEEKFSGAKAICKFYGTRFGPDLDKAAGMARQEYEGLETLRRFNLVGSPHHVIRPLRLCRDINGALAVEYYPGEEFSQAIARATQHCDEAHLYWRLKALAYFLATQHQPDGHRGNSGFHPRVPILRHARRQAQEGPSHRAAGCRRALRAARPLAGVAADVAGPAGLAAR